MDAAFEVFFYQTKNRRIPFREWLDDVSDPVAYAAIQKRLDRLERGLFGDCKPVGEGVLELRIDVGLGYRAYFARAGKAMVLLLCGGAKPTQSADIKRAKDYWKDYEARKRPAGRTG